MSTAEAAQDSGRAIGCRRPALIGLMVLAAAALALGLIFFIDW